MQPWAVAKSKLTRNARAVRIEKQRFRELDDTATPKALQRVNFAKSEPRYTEDRATNNRSTEGEARISTYLGAMLDAELQLYMRHSGQAPKGLKRALCSI